MSTPNDPSPSAGIAEGAAGAAPPQALLPAPDDVLLLPAPEPKASAWQRQAKPITAIALAAFLLVAFCVGWFLHHRRAEAAEASNKDQREQMPMASVIAAKRSPSLSELLLPGSLSPLTEASMYARAAGYVRHRYVDIGDTVKKGQVLAEIESPELDQQVVQGLASVAQAKQQLNQVRAGVGDAKAKLDLARVGWERWQILAAANAVAKQDADQRKQEFDSAQAALEQAQANVGSAIENVRAAQANQQRLLALQDFERLRAPFDGVITARSFDEGALIGSNGASLTGGSSSTSSSSGGSSSGSPTSTGAGSSSSDTSSGSSGSQQAGPPLFRIAQVDRLRVYVSVPQGNAAAIQVGSDATVLVQQFDEPVAGRVSRTARALDPDSRTLLTEVQIDNHAHALIPGMYAQVRFSSARSNPPLLIPGEALIVRGDGMQVATVGPVDGDQRSQIKDSADSRCAREVQMRPVAIGRDYGSEVEITKGLRGGEFVVVNPGDSVRDKAVVLPRLQTNSKEGEEGSGKSGGQKAGQGGASGAKGGDKSGGKQSGDDQAGDKKDGDKKDGDKKGQSDAEAAERQEAQRSCIEERVAQQARSPQPSDTPNIAPGGQSEQTPSGVQSPSIAAPTQGQKQKK